MAAAGKTLFNRIPSHCARNPSPKAAPKLAMAGKQNEQPIAAITAPSEPDLSPKRVKYENKFVILSTEYVNKMIVNPVPKY